MFTAIYLGMKLMSSSPVLALLFWAKVYFGARARV